MPKWNGLTERGWSISILLSVIRQNMMMHMPDALKANIFFMRGISHNSSQRQCDLDRFIDPVPEYPCSFAPTLRALLDSGEERSEKAIRKLGSKAQLSE